MECWGDGLFFAEEEQEMVIDHFEMQKANPDEIIFAQDEVGDCGLDSDS